MQTTTRNLIGPQLRRLRSLKDWSRNELATKLQLLGLGNATPSRVYKIEIRSACVTDDELIFLARALNVSTDELYPAVIRGAKRLYDAVRTSKVSRFGCLVGALLFLSNFGQIASEISATIASV